jgi:3,4-dihydroxy 2-butanone 4-phosphate synthase/GTP cyclohydrolase II
VDLARLAGLKPAGVICEIMDNDGTMASMPALEEVFGRKHGIGICTIADLVKYRMRKTESPSCRTGRGSRHARPGWAGEFRIIAIFYKRQWKNLTAHRPGQRRNRSGQTRSWSGYIPNA